MRPGPGERLLLSHALAATAMSLPWPGLLAAVWYRTASDDLLGLTGAARMLPYVLLSAAAGILADRFRRSAVLRWSAAARAVLLLGCTLAASAQLLAPAVLLAALVVAAGTPAYPAAVAALPRLAGPRAGLLTPWLVTVEVTAFVVGPAVGGVLLGLGRGAWALPVAVLLAVLAVPLLLGLDSGPVVVEPVADDRGRLRTVLEAPGVVPAIAVVALVNLVEAAASVGLLALSHQRWLDGDRGFGTATAALGFGSLAAPLVTRLVRRRGALLAGGSGLALAALLPGAALAAAPLALAGAAGTTVECLSTEVLQQRVPDRARAFSLGLTDAVMVLAAGVGALVAPQLVRGAGPVPAFCLLALLLGAGCLLRIELGVRSRPRSTGSEPGRQVGGAGRAAPGAGSGGA